MDVYIAGKRLCVSPHTAIGKGGEADIYAIGDGLALKLFKPPNHPDLVACPGQQQEAAKRLAMHQYKLPAFPQGLPERVIAPLALATDRQGRHILGYTMRLVQGAEVLWRYGEKSFRQHGVGATVITAIFRDLHATVTTLHAMSIIIGDFNDLNVLVQDTRAYLIDADSFQFGQYLCQVYTERCVDPLLCDPTAMRPMLVHPYTVEADWYAFAVMLFRALLLADPYGGVYTPGSPSQQLPHSARPLRRLTIFDPNVRYPKPAYRYDILPEALLQYFYEVFKHDRRGAFPLPLLDNLTWTTCPHCRLEHARTACPVCNGSVPSVAHAVVSVRGKVTARRITEASGPIVWATADNGTLRFLVHTNEAFYRNGQQRVCSGQLHPLMVWRLLPDKTLVGQGNQLVMLADSGRTACLQVDTCNGAPVFDTNGSTYFWVQDGQLLRAMPLGPERIGDVLPGQTRIWVGPTLGFGFYRAGELHVAFVFDPHRRGLNDSVRLPSMHGQLVDITCQLAHDRCWLIWRATEHGQMMQHAAVILANGKVEATTSAAAGTAPWMGSAHGALAVDAFLLVPTDDGIVRVEARQGRIVLAKMFPETEPFVDAASRLLAGPDGLYVVRGQSIYLLTMGGA